MQTPQQRGVAWTYQVRAISERATDYRQAESILRANEKRVKRPLIFRTSKKGAENSD